MVSRNSRLKWPRLWTTDNSLRWAWHPLEKFSNLKGSWEKGWEVKHKVATTKQRNWAELSAITWDYRNKTWSWGLPGKSGFDQYYRKVSPRAWTILILKTVTILELAYTYRRRRQVERNFSKPCYWHSHGTGKIKINAPTMVVGLVSPLTLTVGTAEGVKPTHKVESEIDLTEMQLWTHSWLH